MDSPIKQYIQDLVINIVTYWQYDTYCFITQENITNQKSDTTNILHKRLFNIIKQIHRKLLKNNKNNKSK